MSVQWLVQGSFFFPVLKSEHLTIPVCRVSHLHSAFCQHWKLSPWKTQSKTKQKKRKKAQLSVFTSLKPQQQKSDDSCLHLPAQQSGLTKKKLSVVEVKGYGRVLFVRIFEKKNKPFLCSLLPSPLLLCFLCLSILFAVVHLCTPPSFPTSLLLAVLCRHFSSRKSALMWCRVHLSPLKVETGDWRPYLAVR